MKKRQNENNSAIRVPMIRRVCVCVRACSLACALFEEEEETDEESLDFEEEEGEEEERARPVEALVNATPPEAVAEAVNLVPVEAVAKIAPHEEQAEIGWRILQHVLKPELDEQYLVKKGAF